MGMAGTSFDSKGERITTDILVSGYIKNVVKECNLLIADEIRAICYVFWLIKACDEWDKDSSTEYIKIDRFKVQTTKN